MHKVLVGVHCQTGSNPILERPCASQEGMSMLLEEKEASKEERMGS